MDEEGAVRKWFNTNFGGNKNPEDLSEDSLAEYFSLSKNDIEKFTPKSKKKIKDEGERTLNKLREENPNASESDIQELYADTAWGNPFDDDDYAATGKLVF